MARDTSGSYIEVWTNGNESLASLQEFFNQQTSLDHIIQTVTEMTRVLSDNLTAVIIFALFIGLRVLEAYESVKLLILRVCQLAIPYYNQISKYYSIILYPISLF